MKELIKNKQVSLKMGLVIGGVVLIAVILSIYVLYSQLQKSTAREKEVQISLSSVNKKLDKTSAEYTALKSVDQVQRNDVLEKENSDINKTYKDAVNSYESLLKLKESATKTALLDETFAKILTLLSDRNYSSASASIKQLNADIQKQQAMIASSFKVPSTIQENSTAPGNGYQRQLVKTDRGDYMVDIIAADLNSTKVIVDTASDSTCGDNCPVMALGEYASRSGAYAAVNGQYFCPASYPSCAGKANAFDTLLMNKNKVYFNSDNNVYSNNPAAVFGSGFSRFMGRAADWGRSTDVDAVISNYPLLVSDGTIAVSDPGDNKQSGKGSRAFIGGSDTTVYIGVIYNANVTDMATVLKTMGVKNALNLDSGGSLALWNNGRYITGPGRGLPFGILLVHR